jgi:putative transposase
VWAADITYIPPQKGFLYLVAIVDLFSRNVLSWKLSNSLDTEFCLEALGMALEGGRKPEIFHCGQAAGREDQDQLVKQKALLRQQPGGEAVAHGQIRGGLPTCLQRWLGG